MGPLSGECAKEGYRNMPLRQSPRYPVNYGENQEIDFNGRLEENIATNAMKCRMKGEVPEGVGPMLGPDGRPVIGAGGKMVMVDTEGRPIQPSSGIAGSIKDKGKVNVANCKGRRSRCSLSLMKSGSCVKDARSVQSTTTGNVEYLCCFEWRHAHDSDFVTVRNLIEVGKSEVGGAQHFWHARSAHSMQSVQRCAKACKACRSVARSV